MYVGRDGEVGGGWRVDGRLESRGRLAPPGAATKETSTNHQQSLSLCGWPQRSCFGHGSSPRWPCLELAPTVNTASLLPRVAVVQGPCNTLSHFRIVSQMSAVPRVNPSAGVASAVASGSQLNNEALRLERQGDIEGAERKHLEAIRVKEAGLGTDDVTTALSYNGLGELYLTMQRLDKAEEYLNKALRVREHAGPRSDLAVTRDNLGRLFEMKGDLQAAEEMRLRGAPDNVACSNYNVNPAPGSRLWHGSPSVLVHEPIEQSQRAFKMYRLQGTFPAVCPSWKRLIPDEHNQ